MNPMPKDTLRQLEFIVAPALAEFGGRAQMIKACEEFAEAQAILCKRLNDASTPAEAVIDEIADVLIMAFQMRHLFGGPQVDDRISFKIERMRNLIEKLKGTSG